MVGKKGKKELNGAGGLRRVGREGNGGVSPFHFFPYGGGMSPSDLQIGRIKRYRRYVSIV